MMDSKLVTEEGIKYYPNLPENTKLCTSLRDFFRIKPGKKSWEKKNIEKIPDMYFLIHSPAAGKYFVRQTHELTNYKKLIKYIEDKNLYLFTDL